MMLGGQTKLQRGRRRAQWRDTSEMPKEQGARGQVKPQTCDNTKINKDWLI